MANITTGQLLPDILLHRWLASRPQTRPFPWRWQVLLPRSPIRLCSPHFRPIYSFHGESTSRSQKDVHGFNDRLQHHHGLYYLRLSLDCLQAILEQGQQSRAREQPVY